VLFDVDGTLVDTNYLHAVTWWQAFAQAATTASRAGAQMHGIHEIFCGIP
jgi:beta-phosphoglucomutase-like phosphatase (HAD superfamily)